ncbi:site-2 protease family protein [Pseudoroseomonas wenyumeiae]|uniref:Site-2 protease family protein n=1 Tax=Teichococcus wenyumeiae TaxID=2478470 RepID=A0A3A9JYR5_9PROT|nr:site-2 protease family protein [Pseudoroseomonas wenyumeiae]RKK04249.1 site-2 protease family protein [Pseudoroseomonas wenyumeiae]RMI19175.1 site-2 protease family protein [Pseudoroseomonas wenyumeiae]
MIDWLPELIVAILATVVAITLHEAAHGYAALALGDDTAREAGRLSLNPIRHVDRVGTIILPGILLVTQLLTIGRVVAMFGWAKPVPVNPWRLRNPRYGMVLVAAAGPAMNFFLAWVAALLAHVVEGLAGTLPHEVVEFGIRFIALSIMANLLLGLFNLLPIPPLDGGRIAVGLLPRALAAPLARTERFGLLLVMLMILLLPRLGPQYDVIGWLSGIVTGPAFRLVLWLAGHPV